MLFVHNLISIHVYLNIHPHSHSYAMSIHSVCKQYFPNKLTDFILKQFLGSFHTVTLIYNYTAEPCSMTLLLYLYSSPTSKSNGRSSCILYEWSNRCLHTRQMTIAYNSGTPFASLEFAIFWSIRSFNSISPGNLPSFSLENTFKVQMSSKGLIAIEKHQ